MVAVVLVGCSEPSAFETPDGLTFAAFSDLPEREGAALVWLWSAFADREGAVLGRLDLATDGADGRAFTVAGAFPSIPGEVDDLESLVAAAFEPVEGLEARLRDGRDAGGVEAVLAADVGVDVYLFAFGDPDVLDALIDHLDD